MEISFPEPFSTKYKLWRTVDWDNSHFALIIRKGGNTISLIQSYYACRMCSNYAGMKLVPRNVCEGIKRKETKVTSPMLGLHSHPIKNNSKTIHGIESINYFVIGDK